MRVNGGYRNGGWSTSQATLWLTHPPVFLVRTDLGMTKGKIAAQCGHATLSCYKAAKKFAPSLVTRWERYGQAKIALQVKSEDELLLLQAKALSLGVVAKVVHDAGRTQIVAGSATVCGIGPAPVSIVNEISGHLKLL
ncbi:peptidyl-tRNA hydrolase [Ascodesmis nigricans]|uniref:peptidyl-tRNA hydrolase n=1 Tax=Ascodesmis nigricans TaxID=341454 RepID=A0A4S2MNR1_9PEZI|nr:peptidyl-tRNA hydrolase [Ascodesmis nigricans]